MAEDPHDLLAAARVNARSAMRALRDVTQFLARLDEQLSQQLETAQPEEAQRNGRNEAGTRITA